MNKLNSTGPAIIRTLIAIILCLNFAACKQANKDKPEDSKDVANKFNNAKFGKSAEAKFLVEATELCYEELEIARLAQSNGANENVKEIGKMMEKDDTQFLEEIKKLAQSKDITIPSEITSRGQKERKKLSADKGSDFDKNYCDMVVENHKKAIKKYMSAVEDCEDVQVKNWANQSLAILRNHLDHAMTCAEAFKENKKEPNKELDRDMKEVNSHPAAKTATKTGSDTKTKIENKTNTKPKAAATNTAGEQK